MNEHPLESPPPAETNPTPPDVESAAAIEDLAAEQTRERLRLLPPEVGAVLMTVGIAGLILPGPIGTPFLLAGGMVLAPRYFERAELWVQKRFPGMHQAGRCRIDRFIDDFDQRFPRNSQ